MEAKRITKQEVLSFEPFSMEALTMDWAMSFVLNSSLQ